MNRKQCVLFSIVLFSLFRYCLVREQAEASDKPGQSRSRTASTATSEPQPAARAGHPGFLSPHASPIAISGGFVYVANTPADTVDVIESATRQVAARIHVGINPVSIAVRPDGKEVWVSNHISDSVSVIDSDPASPTRFAVIDTIQEFDPATHSTRFDEPVGIAFANNAKAYVALSSENQIAIINVATRQIEKRLKINAQDPRAIFVRGNRLYVAPFESNNKTQLSGGTGKIDGDLVTFNATNHSITNNNVLSLGHVVDIIKHPRVPDRDLFIFDTATDTLVQSVDTLGTLLYGLAVDSKGRVFIAQTDARNDANGRSGSKHHGLAELQNRAFLNRITSLSFKGDSPDKPAFFDLEPLPPQQPDPAMALANPFAIQVSDDDKTLVATASGSSKLFTLDTATGSILGRTEVGAQPEGIALESDPSGKPARAWVLNAGADTVALVDLAKPNLPTLLTTIALDDPTDPVIKRGRIAFFNANASTTGTFSCGSCHPDGHTDQLLWVLSTPVVTGGNQIQPRSTMPIRGLRDTAPFHWDGIPGDPYGGINSASVHKAVPPNSSSAEPESSARHLIDGGLASTMSLPGDKTLNDEQKPGRLSAADREAMAAFLLSVPYPPAQRRSFDNRLSRKAADGFKLFHIEGDIDPSKPKPNVCGDCHRMPFLVSTNTPGSGMDAPTWRGAYDRWLILPQGRLNIIDFPFFRSVADQGSPERSIWQFSWANRRRFDPVWDMVLEASTGFSGAFARQITLNRHSHAHPITAELLNALEQASAEGASLLQAEGLFINKDKAIPVALQFDAQFKGGSYVASSGNREAYSRSALVALAQQGRFIGTFTARMGLEGDIAKPQPALWTLGPIEKQTGTQKFPAVYPGHQSMKISGRHIRDNANLFVDGIRAPGSLKANGETIEISLQNLPPTGLHFLQVQNPDGLFSNDFLFHVTQSADAAQALYGHSLADILQRSEWNQILGTWVDTATQGKLIKTTYAWKIPGEVIEVSSHEPQKDSVSLIIAHPVSHLVTQTGANSDGTTFSSSWDFKAPGHSLLKVAYTTRDGNSGTLQINQQLKGPDSLTQTLLLATPITIEMNHEKKP